MYKTIFSVLFCGFIEWYDFALYGHLSYLFSKIFFPSSNNYISLLLSLITFAVGFIARPLGAIIFGYIGDKKGRRVAFVSSLIAMLAANAVFVIIPTFEVWGIASTIILVLVRIVQGLSLGGESGGVVLLAESINTRYRIFICGMKPVSCICGVVAAYFAVEICRNVFSELQFHSWAWRIPVALGFIMTTCILYLRLSIKAKELPDKNSLSNPLKNVLQHNKRTLIIASGLYSLSAASFYVFTILLNVILQTSYNEQGLGIILYGLLMITAILSCIISSLVCSIFNTRKSAMFFASLFIMLSYIIFYLIELKLTIGYFILAILSGLYLSSVVSLPILMFHRNVRQTGVSLAYNIGGAIFGGTAPAICISLIRILDSNIAPSFYLMFCASISFIALYFSRKLKIYE